MVVKYYAAITTPKEGMPILFLAWCLVAYFVACFVFFLIMVIYSAYDKRMRESLPANDSPDHAFRSDFINTDHCFVSLPQSAGEPADIRKVRKSTGGASLQLIVGDNSPLGKQSEDGNRSQVTCEIVDFHPEFQQIASTDTATGEFQEARLQHREEA